MTTTVVVGNPKPASRTLVAARQLAEALTGRPVDHVLDLALVPVDEESAEAAVRTVARSSVVVVASPTVGGTYTGLLKLFLDRFADGPGLQGVVVVPLMVGAGLAHAMAPELLLKPVLAELGATCEFPGLYLPENTVDDSVALKSYARRWAPVTARLAAARASGEVAPTGPIAPPFTPAETADGRALRDAFGCFPSGVAAVCALVDGKPTGMAVSSFTSVSLDPPLVSVCVDNGSSTWPRLRDAGRVGVSVLGEAHESACRSLSAKTGDRFAGLSLHTTDAGAVLITGATAWLDCTIEDEIPAGDHHIVLLRIIGLRTGPETRPLVFHRSRFPRLVEVPAAEPASR